ncbi:hypothetical protein BV898_19278 [Hypsibius exemplaris]|uniref:Uncharacterized protein n=1 Tax=Hypsibius exemplaris TaxID=2072580 RepID=A0A9X6NLD6_HYPEX|nr:hypothetical protein BV898_19278 [Hypsibius exemplaris]
MDKLPILRRNLQEDGHTYCFSSEMYFLRTDGVVKPISPAAAHYVWVQAKLANLVPLLPYNGQGDTDVLEIIRAKLQDDNMPDNFICFLLVCGECRLV